MEPIRFDSFALHEEPVFLGDKKFVLREASSGAATRYRNALLDCATMGPEGKPSKLSGMASVEPLLVSLCLFEEDGKPVPLAEIERWPSKIVKRLFNRVKDVSDLDEAEDELGNESEPTAPGSG